MSTGCIIPQNAVDDFKMILWDGMLGGNRLLDFSDGSSHDVYPEIFDGFSSLRDSANGDNCFARSAALAEVFGLFLVIADVYNASFH